MNTFATRITMIATIDGENLDDGEWQWNARRNGYGTLS